MPSGGPHKDSPIPWRPPARTDDRAWLVSHAEATGSTVNAVITLALREYRERAGDGKPQTLESPTT
jgi:hypothetical protein